MLCFSLCPHFLCRVNRNRERRGQSASAAAAAAALLSMFGKRGKKSVWAAIDIQNFI